MQPIVLLVLLSFLGLFFGATGTVNSAEFAELPNDIAIAHPLSSKPLIVERGDTIDLNISCGGAVPPIKDVSFDIALETAYDSLALSYALEVVEFKVAEPGYLVTALIPDDACPDLYNLTITYTLGGFIYTDTQPRAVSIVDTIDGTFTFVQLSDPHVGDVRIMASEPTQATNWGLYRQAIEEINLIHPDFVIITGDLTGQSTRGEYAAFYDLLQHFDVPTYTIPGNHDGFYALEDGLALYAEYLGNPYFSFNYGDAHFTMVNTYEWPLLSRLVWNPLAHFSDGYVGELQYAWLHDDLAAAANARLTVVAAHHPFVDSTGAFSGEVQGAGQQIYDILRGDAADLVLAGHHHADAAVTIGNTTHLTTTTAASGTPTYHGYRIIDVVDYAVTAHSTLEGGSIRTGMLALDVDDDGATIINDHPVPLTVHVSLYINSDEIVYPGTIISDRRAGDLREVVVQKKVMPKTISTISVMQAPLALEGQKLVAMIDGEQIPVAVVAHTMQTASTRTEITIDSARDYFLDASNFDIGPRLTVFSVLAGSGTAAAYPYDYNPNTGKLTVYGLQLHPGENQLVVESAPQAVEMELLSSNLLVSALFIGGLCSIALLRHLRRL